MTPEAAPRLRRDDILARIPALLEQHAGREPWGGNNGSLADVLRAWQLDPANFIESLLTWGYTIRIEAAPPPAALDVERLARALHEARVPSDEWMRNPGSKRCSGPDAHANHAAAIAAAYAQEDSTR